MRTLVAVCVCLLLAASASAQNVVNPTKVEFTASADHAVLTSYVLGHFLPGATDPMQEVDLGKPTPDAAQLCVVTLNTRPISFGLSYTARIKSVAGAVVGEWSAASNAWDRRPGKTGDPVVK